MTQESLHVAALAPTLSQLFASTREASEQFTASIDQAYDELEAWRRSLEQFEEQLHAERRELVHQQELRQQELEQDAADPASESGTPPADPAALEALRKELEDARHALDAREGEVQRLAAAQSEQEAQASAVEAELEKVRTRAAELSDTLTQSKRQWDARQAAWELERAELQRASRAKAELKRGSSSAEVERTERAPTDDEPEKAVMGSILAQFAKLRDEQASRHRPAPQEAKA